MLQAYVLVTVRMGEAVPALHALRRIAGVRYAQTVTGPYDVVVFLDAADVDVLGKLVQEQLQKVPGVVRTLTCPVFHR